MRSIDCESIPLTSAQLRALCLACCLATAATTTLRFPFSRVLSHTCECHRLRTGLSRLDITPEASSTFPFRRVSHVPPSAYLPSEGVPVVPVLLFIFFTRHVLGQSGAVRAREFRPHPTHYDPNASTDSHWNIRRPFLGSDTGSKNGDAYIRSYGHRHEPR